MTVPSPTPGEEASLAAHARFLRGLARGLLFDRSSADDVAQRALLVALEQQRRSEGKGDAARGFSLRAWLAGVVRNLAWQEGREQRRRAAREQAAARPERAESAFDSVARLEMTQRVVAAVRALEEPYRTVVVLRWFDGLKPAAIAKRTGAPVETVRTRLKRALEQLRQRLDAQHGGDRAQWGIALLPVALPTGGGIAGGVAASATFHALALGGVGAVAMSTKVKAIAGAVAALLATTLLVGTLERQMSKEPHRSGDGGDDAVAIVEADAIEERDPSAAAPDPISVERVELAAPEPPPLPDRSMSGFDATVVGHVLDERGMPLAGAMVGSYHSEEPTACDERGAYRIRACSASGEWQVGAWAPGFAEATGVVVLRGPGSTVTLDFRLHAGFEVVGRVVDERGAPIAAATLSAMTARYARVASDADGRYRLMGLDPRTAVHTLQAEHADYMTAVAAVGPGDDAVALDFVLRRGGRIEGVALGHDGAPVRDATLSVDEQLFAPGVHLTRSRFAYSDEDGSFLFVNVTPGVVELSGKAVGLPPATMRVDVSAEPGRATPVTFRFANGRFLEGFVTDLEGAPIPGARVAASRNGSVYDHSTGVDAEGRFKLGPLADEALQLMASAEGFVSKRLRDAKPDGGELRFELARAGQLAGRVVDAATGEPVRSFRIRFVMPRLESGEEQGSGYDFTWSEPGRSFDSDDGVWRCDGNAIEPGSLFAIEATAAGYAPAIAPRVVCAIDAEPDDCVLRLSRGARIEGRVVGDDGRPVAGATLTLATPNVPVNPNVPEARDARWIVRSDERGGFAIDGAPAGACTLVVEHDDWIGAVDGPFEVPESGEAAPRKIALARGGAIEGVLLDADGRPDAGRIVTLYPTSNRGPLSRMQHATTDGDGRFVFARLASAIYQVSSQQKREVTTANELTARVAVVAPETATLRLAPTGSARVVGRVESAGSLPASIELHLRWLGAEVEVGVLPHRGGYALGDRFDFPRVEPGRYELTASCYVAATQQWISASETLDVAEGKTAEVVLRLAAR